MDTFSPVLEIIFVLVLQWSTIPLDAQTKPTSRTPRPPRSPKTTLSYRDILKERNLQSLYFEFYPNYGYEPYWADGEWVLSTTTDASTSLTTKKIKVCGEECNYLYRRIHHVCARMGDDERRPYYNCFGNKCSGKSGDEYDFGYKTFDTYCEFLDAQCRFKFYEGKRWVLVHVGKCKLIDHYFKPLWSDDQPVSRQAFYLTSLHNMTVTTDD